MLFRSTSQSKAPHTKEILDQPTQNRKLSKAEKTEIKFRMRELARQWREEAARKLREKNDEETII